MRVRDARDERAVPPRVPTPLIVTVAATERRSAEPSRTTSAPTLRSCGAAAPQSVTERSLNPLWQEPVSTPASVKDLRCEPCAVEVARSLNAAWHSRLPHTQTGPWQYAFAAHKDGVVYAVALWHNPSARTLPKRSRDPYTWKTFDAITLIAERALAEGAAAPPLCSVCGQPFVVCDDSGARPEGEW
jgi:hypothetical protein